MIARVVTKREDVRLALGSALVGALTLLAILADDLWVKTLFRPTPNGAYLFVAGLIALAAIAPWLAWTRRGRAVQVRFGDGVILAGTLRIAKGEVSALSIAKASRGISVAIRHGKKAKPSLTFIEVERVADAEKIKETLGGSEIPSDDVQVPVARRALAVPQIMLSMAGLLCAPLYWLAAARHVDVVTFIDGKSLFGVGGVVFAQLTLLLAVLRTLLGRRGHVVALRAGTWDAHAALHRVQIARNSSPEASAVDAEVAPARAFSLSRGDEGVRDWLVRLDAMPTDQHAYRGDVMKKDLLWETLGDHDASVDARMGAARVLRRRYGEEQRSLIRVVDDPEVRVRVEAALEEHEEAERHIEHLGPLFRAR